MWIKSLLCYIPLLLGIAYTSCPLSCSSKPDVQFGWIFHVPLDSTKVIPSLNHGFWRVFIQYSREEISLSNFIAPQKFSIGPWVNGSIEHYHPSSGVHKFQAWQRPKTDFWPQKKGCLKTPTAPNTFWDLTRPCQPFLPGHHPTDITFGAKTTTNQLPIQLLV